MSIVKGVANVVKSVTRDIQTGGKRSPLWRKVEKEHLKNHPMCECCTSTKKLNVHHIRPFHLHPELELDPTNLITLCMDNDCHLYVGHLDNFRAYNPNVLEDVASVRVSVPLVDEALKKILETKKNNRLFE